MILTYVWFSFFIIAFISGLVQWLYFGNAEVFSQIVNNLFSMSKLTIDIAIGLIGVMSFWLGMMKIAEHSGLMAKLAKLLSPLFTRLMPQVPANHPAIASITMNLSANVLGLDNAATPLGLKAMQDLQTLNPKKDTATNAQILFLVLNTSSVTLFPLAVFVFRAQQGAVNPTDVFIPIILATCASTLAGLFAVAIWQRISLFNTVIIGYFALFFAAIAGLVLYFAQLSAQVLSEQSALFGNLLIFSMLILFLLIAIWRHVDVYQSFITGAKQGLSISIKLMPYLLAMLTAIGALRASGALDLLLDGIRTVIAAFGWDARFVDALPTAIMKPFSGSGARAMMVETMQHYGADSFAGRLASIMQGSTETTFYVLAVYFGSVGIRYSRHALACGLIADLAGITAAIAVCYWFFG